MKVGILGTGMVGAALGKKLVELGHDVKMGARSAGNEKAEAFAREASGKGAASAGAFADAAEHGEWVFLCVGGANALSAVEQAGPERLAGKVLVDVSNPLDFSQGFPPTLSTAQGDSAGEQVQKAAPEAKVVKALNTVANELMVDPGRVPGEHDLLICGDDEGAKEQVTAFLKDELGWKSVIDLGDITNARGTEAWLLLWTRLYAKLGTGLFNIHIKKGE